MNWSFFRPKGRVEVSHPDIKIEATVTHVENKTECSCNYKLMRAIALLRAKAEILKAAIAAYDGRK